MEIKLFRKEVILIGCLVFLFSGLAFAQGQGVVRMQGMVDKVYLDKKIIIINEEFIFVWDENTIFSNEKGSPITIDKFKRNNWVYIEGVSYKKGKPALVRNKKDKPALIKKMYLLPKEIRVEERHLYPFMAELE